MCEKLVNIRDADAAHDSLVGHAVLLRKLRLKVLQKLDLEVGARRVVRVAALARVGVVACGARREVALAEAGAGADARDDTALHPRCVLQHHHLLRPRALVEGEQPVAVGHEVVDEAHARDAHVGLDGVAVDAPVAVRELHGVLVDGAGDGEARRQRRLLLHAGLAEEALDHGLEALVAFVLVLRAVHQTPRRPRAVVELHVGLDLV
mmetsp:Transcript_24613/g.77153  ORF Transcript_24613/g.77153 Transcript_24613/m.77153 type:complete len:207 (+) Transcript_24613:226-846(+)